MEYASKTVGIIGVIIISIVIIIISILFVITIYKPEISYSTQMIILGITAAICGSSGLWWFGSMITKYKD